MKQKKKFDANKMTRAIRDELYKRYQADPEAYYRHFAWAIYKDAKEISGFSQASNGLTGGFAFSKAKEVACCNE